MRRLLGTLGAFAIVLALAQVAPARAQLTGPVQHPSFAWTLTANGSVVANNIQDFGSCVPTIYAGANFGGGTITFKVYGDNGNQSQAVSGVKDLGNPASPAPTQTTTTSGQWTIPVAGSTQFAIVLSGATSPNISGWLNCNKAAALVGGGGGGSSAAPTPIPTPANGVYPVTCSTPCNMNTPAPITTLAPLASPSALPSPGPPYELPVSTFSYFWNGVAWVPVTSTAPLPVSTPSPGPTATIGTAVPLTSEVGPSPGAQSSVQGGYTGAVDSNGHRSVSVCSSQAASCVGVIGTTNNMFLSGLVGVTKTKLSASSGTCTLLSASAANVIYGITYPIGAAQTGTLTIYDESTATCSATDAIYSSAARPATSSTIFVPNLDSLPVKVTSGIVYEWTTAGEVGNVYLLSL